MKKLRLYQEECLQAIEDAGPGKWAIAMSTGAGKTFTFTQIKTEGKILILSHREELVKQVIPYYDEPVGIEMGKLKSNGERIVSASFMSIINRLDKFAPDEFDIVITDEFHHSAAKSFKKVLQHFKPYQHLGFSATPFRADGEDLSELFTKVIFKRDLRFCIENKFLCDLTCKRVNIGYDLTGIKKAVNDYSEKELAKRVNIEGANKAIAEIYAKCEKPAIIFAVNIAHAEAIQKEIGEDAVLVIGITKDRAKIIEDYKLGKIKCLITVAVLTEGVDIPNIQTGILARPTKSEVLYIQMVGRILRLSEGKKRAVLIDCVGTASQLDLCSAPCLLGLSLDAVPESTEIDIIGDLLLDLPPLIQEKSDCPESWIKNIQIVNIWKKKRKLQTYNVDYFKFPTGELIVGLPNNCYIGISKENELGFCHVYTNKTRYKDDYIQANLLKVFEILKKHKKKDNPIWNTKAKSSWGKSLASEKQKRYCYGLMKQNNIQMNLIECTKMQISAIINRLKYSKKINKIK